MAGETNKQKIPLGTFALILHFLTPVVITIGGVACLAKAFTYNFPMQIQWEYKNLIFPGLVLSILGFYGLWKQYKRLFYIRFETGMSAQEAFAKAIRILGDADWFIEDSNSRIVAKGRSFRPLRFSFLASQYTCYFEPHDGYCFVRFIVPTSDAEVVTFGKLNRLTKDFLALLLDN